jgi:hypothetical protein
MENLTIGHFLDEVEAAIRIEAIKWSGDLNALDILLLNHRKFGLLLMEKYSGRELSEYMAFCGILGTEGLRVFEENNRLSVAAMRLTLKQVADDAHDAKSQQH